MPADVTLRSIDVDPPDAFSPPRPTDGVRPARTQIALALQPTNVQTKVVTGGIVYLCASSSIPAHFDFSADRIEINCEIALFTVWEDSPVHVCFTLPLSDPRGRCRRFLAPASSVDSSAVSNFRLERAPGGAGNPESLRVWHQTGLHRRTRCGRRTVSV
jgi:hypothetical protein